MITIEQQIFSIMEAHGLTSLSIHGMRSPGGRNVIFAYAHGGGLCGQSELGHSLANEAASDAIGKLNAVRCPLPDVEPFQPMGGER